MKMLKVILMTAGMATGCGCSKYTCESGSHCPATVTTVKQALASKDNTPVKLHGQVVKSLGDEKYQFRDKSGSITIDVDDELWQGRPVSANTNVTLIGEVDIDYKP